MKLQITENNVLILDSTPIYHAYDITIQSHAKLVPLSIFYQLLGYQHPKTYHFKSIPGLIYSLSIIQSNASVQRIVQ